MAQIKAARRTRCNFWVPFVFVLALLSAVISTVVHAHEIRPAVVTIVIADNARYEVEIVANLEAMLAGVSPQHRDTRDSPNAARYDTLRATPPEGLREQAKAFVPGLLKGLRVEFDDAPSQLTLTSIEIPPVGDLGVSRLSRIRLAGAMRPGTKTFRWTYPAEFGPNVLRFQRPQDREPTSFWLKEGSSSDRLPLQGELLAKSGMQVAVDYLVLGFTHILPKGLDHILFVLGLFLLSTRLKPLLVQVTAFTVAHSITLGLTIYGVLSLSPDIVEPLIAASIVYVAVENLFTSTLHAWRPVVVFVFGLLHGMGFAGVLQEIGLPRSEFVTGLVAFNVGVEFGQLAVIAIAFGVVGIWGHTRPWYRARVVIPASFAIALVGLYWTVERWVG